MASYGAVCFIALIFVTAVCCLPVSEGEDLSLSRSRRSKIDEAIKAAADTEAASDSKASHGAAQSTSKTKGSAVFVSKDSHHIHKRSPQPADKAVEVAVADTAADSDSKASEGVASSSSSTKGSAVSVTKVSHHGHHYENHRDEKSKLKEDLEFDHEMEDLPRHESEGTEGLPSQHYVPKHRQNAERIKNLLHLG